MKNMKLSVIIFSFVMGVILTVFAYQAYTIYQLRTLVANDHATLQNVVNFLNTQIQAANPGAAQGSNKAPSEE